MADGNLVGPWDCTDVVFKIFEIEVVPGVETESALFGSLAAATNGLIACSFPAPYPDA